MLIFLRDSLCCSSIKVCKPSIDACICDTLLSIWLHRFCVSRPKASFFSIFFFIADNRSERDCDAFEKLWSNFSISLSSCLAALAKFLFCALWSPSTSFDVLSNLVSTEEDTSIDFSNFTWKHCNSVMASESLPFCVSKARRVSFVSFLKDPMIWPHNVLNKVYSLLYLDDFLRFHRGYLLLE